MTLRAASCFSGIGAPEVAMPHWNWLWCAEIEKFPSAVMAFRHPESQNLGDVTSDDFMQRATSFGRIDVLAGGPPCQAFSVAGLRKSMDDDRGNLSLRFVKIAHAIRPRNLLVENVPGWLNTPDNAFGCFLGAILGCDDALYSPADGKWPRTGMASGPLGRLSWATLDAQYFGLAQRRQRVFVVVDFGNGADPAAVLFEPEGMLGDPPTRGKATKDVAGTIAARTKGGGGLGTDFELDGGLTVMSEPERTDVITARMVAFGEYETDGTASTLKQRDYKDATDLIAYAIQDGRPIEKAQNGIGWNADGSAYTVDTQGSQAVVYGIDGEHNATDVNVAMGPLISGSRSGGGHPLPAVVQPEPMVLMERGRTGGSNLEYRQDGTSNAILTPNGGRSGFGVGAIALEAVAFGGQMSNPQVDVEMSQTLQAKNPQAVAFAQNQRDEVRLMDIAGALASEPGMKQQTYIQEAWSVRRLTPVECARLQGFPDNYLDITFRGKPAVDGPKYKALGNSWAVPNGRWIMERIERFMP